MAKGKNTKIEFLYRDAANYKMWNAVVVKGTVPNLIDIEKEIREQHLIDGEYFYPLSLGLPANNFANSGYKAYADDPDWYEFIGFVAVDTEPNVGKTFDELIADFRAGKAKETIQA